MQTTLSTSTDIPTALPDIEADEEREKLLLEDQTDTRDDELYADDLGAENIPKPGGSRRRKVLNGLAGFSVFLLFLGVAITWFFGMGWFATPKPQPVNRTGQKDATSAPMTEDEKLKAALTMVASKEPVVTADSVAAEDVLIADRPDKITDQSNDTLTVPNSRPIAEPPMTHTETSFSPQGTTKGQNEYPIARSNNSGSPANIVGSPQSTTSIEPLGRSLFFGIAGKKTDMTAPPATKPTVPDADTRQLTARSAGPIPFGTLLPVRLVGAIYTLRNSGGVVRMELTQPIEGNGYSYPAGTMVVGNVRGGESVRAFVTVVGLIGPVSGELVRFTGELMGPDGASGISGERKRITGKWVRFFRGLKDTAGSILGSVGSLRSGGTVILSDPLRRGAERMSEDTSQSIFGNDREDTFLEVTAGTSGYVLVTQLPEAATATSATTSISALRTGAEKE